MTVAERNKAIIRRIFEEGLNQGNLAIIDELFDAGFVDHATPDQPPGPAGVKGYFASVRAGFPDIRVTIDDLIAEDARVAVRTTWRGTHLGTYEDAPASGRPSTFQVGYPYRREQDPGGVNHLRPLTEGFHLDSTAIQRIFADALLWFHRPMHWGQLTGAPSCSSPAGARAFSG
jgi:predicted ester cyclase